MVVSLKLSYCILIIVAFNLDLPTHVHTNKNGVVERKHRYITEMSLTLLAHAHMPLRFWVEAFSVAVYIIIWPASTLKFKSPFEVLCCKQPNYLHLQPFGCACFPLLRPYNKHKFQFHSTKCIFLGYSHIHSSFKRLHPFGRIYNSRHVHFNPKEFPFSSLWASSSSTSSQFSSANQSTSVLHGISL